MEEAKQRMIQEYVPGRQVTLAHVIANPQDELARKVGLTNEKSGRYWDIDNNSWRSSYNCR